MIDRRLLAVLATTGILSTALVSLLFHEKAGKPIEILRQDWNLPLDGERLLIPTQEGRFAYTLSMIIRRPFAELEMRFAVLENQSVPYTISLDGGSPKEKIAEIPEIGQIVATFQECQQSYRTEFTELDMALEWRGHDYRAVLLDMTEAFQLLAPAEVPRNLSSVHAFLFNEDGRLSQCYRGCPDFFIQREVAMVDLTIQRNENVTKYAQRASEATGMLPLASAPPLGWLRFRDLKKDDRISVTIAFNPAQIRTRKALLQVVAFYVDGRYYDCLLRILEPS